MAVMSMTGFARAAGSSAPWRWAFELKTVNAKGLDLRLRMPAPFDRVETEARARLAKALARGTCFGTLAVQREGAAIEARIDAVALESIAAAARYAAQKAGLAPPTMDGLLALRGVVETAEAGDDEASIAAACVGALQSVDEAIAALLPVRRGEGAASRHTPRTAKEDRRVTRPPTPIRPAAPRRVRAARRVRGGADGPSRPLDEPPLPGGDPARREADIRRARPAHDPCRRRARAYPRGRAVRPPLDFLAQELAREASTVREGQRCRA